MSASLSWGIENSARVDRDTRTRTRRSHLTVVQRVAQLLVRGERQAEWIAVPARTRATTPIEDLVGRLRQLERYEAGWDGRSANAADAASFDDARSFAFLLPSRGPIPEESIHANGNAVLVFEGDDLYASLQFYGHGEVAAYVRHGTDEWDEDLVFNRRTLPAPLLERLDLKGTG